MSIDKRINLRRLVNLVKQFGHSRVHLAADWKAFVKCSTANATSASVVRHGLIVVSYTKDGMSSASSSR